MNTYHIEPTSHIYGPGTRFVIWTQGCSIKCKGCWNKETWSFKENQIMTVERLMHDIMAWESEIEGVTILGGEPFDQYEETLALCQQIKARGLTIMMYTGYELTELKERKQTDVLDYCDILIAGRYVEALRNTNLQWRGSENQQVLFLTERYKAADMENANYVEIHVEADGNIRMLGYPDDELLKKIS